jgi:hypothetical protein
MKLLSSNCRDGKLPICTFHQFISLNLRPIQNARKLAFERECFLWGQNPADLAQFAIIRQ